MAASNAQSELIEFIAKAMVSDKDAIHVREADGGRALELEGAQDDRGRVIGRQGRIAKAMRAVVAASAVGSDCRIEIVD